MASTPSNRIKLTPSNSPFLSRPSRPPSRPRPLSEPCLSLQRVIGTTCSSPTGLDAVHSSFAYIAGGAVVVVDVSGEHYSQRFYRARPNAVPLLAVSGAAHTSSTANSTPKANDSRNRAAPSPRESLYAPSTDWPESPTSKTWTSRERIKAATCLGLSRDGRYLAVGETGYAPRVLVFNLQDASSDVPLVAISEHTFGVKAVAWSPDTKYLASLGAANDGFLYLWKVDPRTGAAKLFQQNRCTSFVKHMVWMGNNVLTLGVRHVKVWRVDDSPDATPPKQKFAGDGPVPAPPPQSQKPLLGRNILLGSMLDATFCCALPVSDDKAIVCSESGSVCVLDDTNKQMKLTKVVDLGFSISCISSRGENVYIGGKDGQFAVANLDSILAGTPEPTIFSPQITAGLVAMGFLAENLVTIDNKRSIDVWSPDSLPPISEDDSHIPIPGVGDPIVGIQRLSASNALGASFFTWSGPGRINIWDMEGMVKSSFHIPIEQADLGNESDPANQVVVVRATSDGNLFIVGDKLGVLRIIYVPTGECLMETKAHSSNCQDIAIYEGESRFLVASCGRDRTVQLFHRSSLGEFEHFQTLEFSAKVAQVLIPSEDKVLTCSLDRTLQIHDLVSKEGDPDAMAAIPSRSISLRASPSSMATTPDNKAIFVSLLDRSICQFDSASGRLLNSFKCNDEAGMDAVVLESLTYGHLGADLPFLVGISNTDKSVRIYDPQSGAFLDREWGHTEAINGVVLIDGDENARKVVSVGEDGTIMIWALDLLDPGGGGGGGGGGGSRSRDPSPEKIPSLASARPTLRRVLSKAELAEFQRPSPTSSTPSGARRTSPPARPSNRRPSKFQLPLSALRTPAPATDKHHQQQISPSSTPVMVLDDTPSRRAPSSGAGSRSGDSPPPGPDPDPESPKNRARSLMFRRPSLPALGLTPASSSASTAKSRKNSSSSIRGSGSGNLNNGSGSGFGSLGMATEQTCRQLRAYRKKLSASAGDGVVGAEVLAQLEAELRLTVAVVGERAAAAAVATSGAVAGTGKSRGRGQNQNQNQNQSQNLLLQGSALGHGKAVSESVLSGLLDQYSERLVSLLDEKLRLRLGEDGVNGGNGNGNVLGRDGERERPRTAGESSAASASGASSGGVLCEEPESMDGDGGR